MKLYLDANVIIYAIEGEGALRRNVIERLAETEAAEGPVITSRLSRLECRVKPLREGNDRLLQRYDEFFAQESLRVVELSPVVVERATVLRARNGFKTPDALHLATAIEEGAALFLTGDAALRRCGELNVEIL